MLDRTTPYNTGKVRIGKDYKYNLPRAATQEELDIQQVFLKKGKLLSSTSPFNLTTIMWAALVAYIATILVFALNVVQTSPIL